MLVDMNRIVKGAIGLVFGIAGCQTTEVSFESRQSSIEKLLWAEERRSHDVDELSQLASDTDPAIRARTARALGRIFQKDTAQFAEALKICSALAVDPKISVQAEGIFALGQMKSEQALPLLEQIARSAFNVKMRVLALEALGKLPVADHLDIFIENLNNHHGDMRYEAALGIFRRKASLGDSAPKDPQYWMPSVKALATVISHEAIPDFRWREIYALAGMSLPDAKSTLIQCLQDSDPLCRNLAAWGLDRIPFDDEIEIALNKLLSDRDADVLTRAAVALRKGKAEDSAKALSNLLSHPSFHVRRAATEALGYYKACEKTATDALEKARLDESNTVKAESYLSVARLLGDRAFELLKAHQDHPSFLIRFKIAEAAGLLSETNAQTLLNHLLEDPDARVAANAATSLQKFKTDWSCELAVRSLDVNDPSIRGEAASSLAEIGNESCFDALEKAFLSSNGSDWDETRESLLKAMNALAPSAAKAKVASFEKSYREPAPHKAALPKIYSENPRALVTTEKGKLLIELFSSEAPQHVHNFIELAKRGHFNGTVIHRVASNWVVQGGDHRGDGWGATSYLGQSLLDEMNPLHYRRGSIGMPKGNHPDTGGCQIFVTMLPAPKLDGNYTLFGEVIEGLHLLERFEIGDRILSVQILSGE